MDGWLMPMMGGDAAGTLLATLLALGMLRLCGLHHGLVAPADAEAAPLLHVLGLATGIAAGLALLLAMPHGAAFAPANLLAAASPWRISLGECLGRHALPQGSALAGALAALGGDGGPAQVALAWLAALGLGLGSALALRLRHGADRLRALGGFLLLALWTALTLHYAVHLAAWALVRLGFWAFGLGLAVFQHWRYRTVHQDTCISAK